LAKKLPFTCHNKQTGEQMAVAVKSRSKTEKKLTCTEILELKNTEKKIIAKLVSGSLGGGLTKEKNQLVMENLPLAIYMAKKYIRNDIDIQDLVQVAAIGLIKSVRKYNPSRKVRLSYYAVPTIDGELRHYIRDNCYSIRVSRKCVELNARIQKFREEFIYQNGREATRLEIAKKFKFKLKMLDKIMQTMGAHYLTSLDTPISHNNKSDSIRLEDMIGSNNFADAILEKEDLQTALQALNLRDRQIIKDHFMRECSQSDIAKRFCITQAQVSRVLKRACQKIALTMI
jgi:RNA polymerase sigma factor (sigma-70 family)